ncbi:MAG: Gfo/Idh/MocA family oxidoreductase [Clostridiales bacterium]|nr:Gfo/Idh/MocA family oxidoreductase [Clostridiales bacterium]
MKVKAGIIGFGYMGHFHLRKCREMDCFDVAAAYDINPDKLADAREEGLQAYEQLRDFLNHPGMELVFICTPNDVHASLAIACLEAGLHVMCEKPVTMNGEELERVIAAAERAGKIFTVHQNRRWDIDYLMVKNAVDSGVIGQPTTILSRVYGQRGVCFGWRADPKAGGGMLYDWGIHLIDQFLCMFRGHKVTSVYARLQSILTPAVDDSFELQLIFDNNVCAKVQVGTFCLQDLPRWFVYGDRGTLKIDDFSGKTGGMARIKGQVQGFDSVFGKNLGPSRTMAPLKPEYLETLPMPQAETDPYAYHRNLAAAVRGEEASFVSHADMRRDMQVVDAAFLSSRLNQVIGTDI